MKLKISHIADPGNLDKERIAIEVDGDVDVGRFLLLQAEYRDNNVFAWVSKTYWFPDKSVKEGDIVIVYTKEGVNNEITVEDNRIHFFYWRLPEAIWAEEDRAPVLVETLSWKAYPQAPDDSQ